MRPSPPPPPDTYRHTHTHTYTHTLMLSCTLGPHALSRAGSCSPVERHRARGGEGGSSRGRGERGREGERRRGGGEEEEGGGLLRRRWEVSGGAVKRASAPLALLPPSSFSLSLLHPPLDSLPVFGLAHRGCCRGALRTGNEPLSPQTNTGGKWRRT